MTPPDFTFIDQTIDRLGRTPDAVIPILQAIQHEYRYLPRELLERVCQRTDISPARLTGVSTFYTQFRHQPVGKHIISVCHGTACHVKGSGLVQDAIAHQLGLANGADTDADGLFTVERVACLGCCTLAPVIQIDDATFGRLSPAMIPEVLGDFLTQAADGKSRSPHSATLDVPTEGEIRIGLGSCCQAQGSEHVHRAVADVLAETGAPATVKRVGCVGMCCRTPLLELVPNDGPTELFGMVRPDDVRSIVLSRFAPRGRLRRIGHTVSRWLDKLVTDETGDPIKRHALDARDPTVCAFLGSQIHVATEHCSHSDPTDLDEYQRQGGFTALRRVIEKMSPEEVVAEVTASGLRGRGGAGFPAGVKWGRVAESAGDEKYIICNGDEGDPGAFMDRMLLESCPYRIIEGLAIAARSVGAHKGIFYVRAEYPLAVRRVRETIERCESAGILGESVLGTDFHLDLTVKEGAGAFVCGEETALLNSIEGNRGMPRLRPPYPAQRGLWGKPTLVNNVETYASVPWIFRKGATAFASMGTERSKGTKVFALAGKIRNGGLIEVPMGITLREIVEGIGGGVVEGRTLKAVQVGGPSGGCIPAELTDTPVDFEALTELGAIMGSGGLVVLDDADCMVDIARYFLQFTQDQSCGKCTFCRIGTRRMLDILDRIVTGDGKPRDLENLESLGRRVQSASICGLGKTAPNPVLSTLHHFRDEYEAHLQGRCPAGRCKALIRYVITDTCIGCTRCSQFCPVDAIPMTPYTRHVVDDATCTRCDTCRDVCPVDAVVIE